MKKFAFKLLGTAACAACAALFVACGSDDPDPTSDNPVDPETPTVPDTPVSDETYDPAKTTDKEWLEDTGLKVLNLFNANDQKPLIVLVNDIADLYGDYTFDEIADAVDDSRSEAWAASLNNLASDLRNNRYNAMARSIETFTINMARVRGIYEPNSRKEAWTKVGNSDDVVLNFKDKSGRDCSVSVSGSTDAWSNSHTYGDRYDGMTLNLEIPKTLTLKIVQAGVTLGLALIKTDFVENEKLNINAGISLMNLTISDDTQVTPTSVSQVMSLAVGGKTIVNCTATGSGRNLLSLSKWEERVDDENFDGIANSGDATVNVMGRITVKARITDPQAFIDNVAECWDNYDGAPESQAKKAAQTLDGVVDAKVYYNGVSDPQAYLSWEAYRSYSWYSEWSHTTYEEWSTRPLINFYSGGQFDIESYFGSGRFTSVEDLFESLCDSYEVLWR